MTRREKFFLVVIAALIVAWFEAKGREVEVCHESAADRPAITLDLKGSDTTLEYLVNAYQIFNETYFDNRLPKDTKIDLSEKKFMGSTECARNNYGCVIHFNLRYIASPRYADLTMMHEMCHIPTIEERVPGLTGQVALHGPLWRSCMLKLDMQGAFRYNLIDAYDGNRDVRTGVFK